MGFFSGLDTEGYDRQYSDRQLVQRMGGYFRPYTRKVLVVVVMLVIIALAGAAQPILVSKGLDLLGANLGQAEILILSAAVLIAGLIPWGANWLRRRSP